MYYVSYDNRRLSMLVVKHTEADCEYAFTWGAETLYDESEAQNEDGKSRIIEDGETLFSLGYVARSDLRGIAEFENEVFKFVVNYLGYEYQ